MKKKNYDEVFVKFKELDKDIECFLKPLGRGAFGEVREIKIDGKMYAAKLVEKEKSDNIQPERMRGLNIIKIVKISEKVINDKHYDLIIMEKAVLKDIGTLIMYIYDRNLLKLINFPFIEHMGDNLLRHFTKQIISGLKTLEISDLVHFDIKPENLLITTGLHLNISDFTFLKNLRHSPQEFKIPGGTHGYVSPEYYNKKKIPKNIAKKQDYFALGATIFFLKFGHRLLKYKKSEDNKMNKTRVVELLQRGISLVKSDLILDKDFIAFLCGLIEYLPNDRFDFEEIYRNKWLNKDKKEIVYVLYSFLEGEEDKLMEELMKSDFLIEKKKQLRKCKISKFTFKFRK